jgi:hypothetical protein
VSQPTNAIGILAAALVLCAVSISSPAAITGDDDAFRAATVETYDGGGIILTAAARERAGGGQRAGGGREAQANRGGGAGADRQATATTNRQVRSSATSNVNHNRAANANVNRNVSGSVNRDVNVNRNVNIDRDVDVSVRRDYYDGWDDHWHPGAAAAAVTATAMVVGSMVRTLPPSCSTVVVNGVSYSQCGSTWYLPQYSGTTVQYVVVNAPR